MVQDWKKLALGFIFALGGATFSINSAFAQQITIDGTLSPERTLSGPNYIIPQAYGQTVGNNLFQSFGRFNLNAGESANFQSDVSIRNILSRVTGGLPSTIDGRIFTQSANVNLFFINPSGIIFGQNARIDVGSATRGSFIATTADALVWANGSQFSATNPRGASSLLTIVGDPSGFLSTLRPPQPITSSGNNLRVFDGQSLLLLGGNLTLDNSNLQTSGGRVELAGIADTGTVGLEANGNIFSLNVPDNLARADVSLQKGTTIDVTAANQGNIAIVGRNVDITGGSQLRTGIGSGLGTVNSQAGDITVNATGTVTINQASGLSNIVADDAPNIPGKGNAGNINIKAGEIFINNQGNNAAAITTNRSLQGRGGNVLLESKGSIFVTGQNVRNNDAAISTLSRSQSLGSGDISLNAIGGGIFLNNAFFGAGSFGGNGGNISLQGNEISLVNNSSLVSQAFARGNSGSITLKSTGPISIQNTLVNTAVGSNGNNTTNLQVGNAGDINISGRSVSITGESEISSRSFTGMNSGNINVNATEFVEISGNSRRIPRPNSDRARSFPNTILTTTAERNSRGNAGNISIKAGEIFINNQASNPAISSTSSGSGRGGNVLLESTKGSIFVTGQSRNQLDSVISTLSENQSPASGDISLNASGAIKLDNAYFVASSSGQGNGGNISLQGNEISLFNNSSLVNQAFTRGNSGSITLNSTGPISIQNSLVNTAVGRQNNTTTNLQLRNAGDINISGRSVSITGGSEISSRSFTGANSGNINVNAKELVKISGNAPRIPRPRSDRAQSFTNTILTTAAERNSRGNAGNISIKAGEILINNQASNPTLSTNSSGLGRAGNVLLEATNNSISLIGQNVNSDDAVISTFGSFQSQGSGDISLNANGSILLDNALLRASTTGGDAGSILVRGNERVSLANNSALTTEALGRGNAGAITVESFGPISLQNSLIATNVGSRTDTRSTEGLGNAGNIKIQGRSVALTAGSEISSRSFSGGKSGNIEVNGIQFVDISGRASQFPRRGSDAFGATQSVDRANSFPYTTLATTSEQLASGVSGDITVNTPNLRISDGASVRADTISNFSGGSVNINANVVDITSGGQIFTTAFGSGNAGNITLNASDRLNISGRNASLADIFNQIAQTNGKTQAEFQLGSANSEAGIFANTGSISTAQGGNLTINTPLLQVKDGGIISVSSPQGQAGNLDITANTIRLNQGSLTAKTAITRTTEGANIQLRDVDLLLLQNNSLISAQANGTATGGNITINAQNGFVIAPFGENSDIIASASGGRGGNITINTQGLFGFFEGRAIPGNGTNDIDASSEFNNPGTVDINTLDIDPRRGLLELPASVVEVSRLVASNCGAIAGKNGSSFTYTGRGGLPDSPDDPLTSDVVWSDTRLTNIPSSEKISTSTSKPHKQTASGIAIVPATGWVFNKFGDVTLISDAAVVTAQSLSSSASSCSTP
ncbi:filamentous hemagglutinin outer membrane protein [Tolypothrix sp. NIES-4075]|uniref:beta strand repeat-containing protein n=1 Tax=Tolypothrix sp. NIES-4075 TaxID=2005459 RepID=UPI000B5C9D5F|nr:filamentous hemagglutinin N-terminal domain-containing protein [Tolypothrix sp. NIES-4075]GAX40403.1 filamentous hemagglutinin outer membrane protein [Tolypothrix sp. NIES-4075]